jgi:hypothetical protein
MKQNKNARGQPIPSQPKAVSLVLSSKSRNAPKSPRMPQECPKRCIKRLANSQIPMQR